MTEELLYTPETLRAFNFNESKEHDFSPSAFKKRFPASKYTIVYFLEPDSYLVNYSGYDQAFVHPGEIRDRAVAARNAAVLYHGLFFSGLHSETDWSRTKWWSLGWHIVNRSGEYAVVLLKDKPHKATVGKRFGRKHGKSPLGLGLRGIRG